jgi:intracellular sulfur oxidation DsrE/DsrF family protein
VGLALVVLPAIAQAQAIPGMQPAGPRIMSGGMSIQVDDPTFVVPADHTFRAVFEIAQGDNDGADANPQLTTVARFLNLHARHGVPDDQVLAAAVVHGGGWTALLSDEAYGARFDGKTNPTRDLVQELMANGVQVVLCGQTAGARGVRREELLPGVQVALSAMTALNLFLTRGYHLNPW